MSEIDRGVVRYVADLARIALTDDEVERFTGQLSVVLEAVGKLREVDTERISPTASVLPLENVWREDEARPGLSLEEAMRNAPARDGDLFRVQTVIEERPLG
jgi:aspartyl-tRNA(Asn)/glutamyl-tRNA(Gln) amidotransferase subunit C